MLCLLVQGVKELKTASMRLVSQFAQSQTSAGYFKNALLWMPSPRRQKLQVVIFLYYSTSLWDFIRVTILAFFGSLEVFLEFSYAQRQDIMDVGLMAGLNVAEIINGPTVVFISRLAGTRHVATRNGSLWNNVISNLLFVVSCSSVFVIYQLVIADWYLWLQVFRVWLKVYAAAIG
ncbi:hypothetical protein Tco_1463373, partial [Tanacetum coccineum]